MLCDTTSRGRPLSDRRRLPIFTVSDDGVWQDADHVGAAADPTASRAPETTSARDLGVVEGGDDGMAWRQVVWVGCPNRLAW